MRFAALQTQDRSISGAPARRHRMPRERGEMPGDAEAPMKSPPPCGCKTLVQIQWQTSAPMSPGRQSPTCAFMAPSVDLPAMGMDD